MIPLARATRGLRRPSLDARSWETTRPPSREEMKNYWALFNTQCKDCRATPSGRNDGTDQCRSLIEQWVGQIGDLLPQSEQAGRVVHGEDMHLLLGHAIDNAIRALNDFTNLWIGKFRHHPT